MDTEIVSYISNPSIQSIDNCIGGITGIPDSVVDAAKARLIQFLNQQYPDLVIDPNQVILENFKLVVWDDASLGYPQEDHSYAQVLTPGYSIGLKIGDEIYQIHTNADGTDIAIPQFPTQN